MSLLELKLTGCFGPGSFPTWMSQLTILLGSFLVLMAIMSNKEYTSISYLSVQ